MKSEHITKTELLKQTDISYGQLYRWKRQGLIPEEWFIKRSSYTGQETVFPAEQICERIDLIKSLKNKMSHEEIANVIYSKAKKTIDIDAENVFQTDDEILKLFLQEKNALTVLQTAIAVELSKLKKERKFDVSLIKDTIEGWNEKGYPEDAVFLDAVFYKDSIKINFKSSDTTVYYDGKYTDVVSIDIKTTKQNLLLKNKINK